MHLFRKFLLAGRAPTSIFYDPVANFLGLTGDLTSLDAAYPKDGVITVVSDVSDFFLLEY
jgi:hypothetical protein